MSPKTWMDTEYVPRLCSGLFSEGKVELDLLNEKEEEEEEKKCPILKMQDQVQAQNTPTVLDDSPPSLPMPYISSWN